MDAVIEVLCEPAIVEAMSLLVSHGWPRASSQSGSALGVVTPWMSLR